MTHNYDSYYFKECKDLMKHQLCLNVLDFCEVYLVSNYCCETCKTRNNVQSSQLPANKTATRTRRKELEVEVEN